MWCRRPRPQERSASVLLHSFVPAHSATFTAALVRQQDAAHGAQSLLRCYLQRSLLLDRISYVDVEPAIVATFGLHSANFPIHPAQSSPTLLRFLAPIRTPVRAVGAVLASQNLFLRIHPILHE